MSPETRLTAEEQAILLEDEMEASIGRGGSGSGKKKKKRDGKKGKVTIAGLRAEQAANSASNKAEYLEKHPETSQVQNIEIDFIIQKLIEEDKSSPGLPTLKKYVQWLYQILDTYESSDDTFDIESECSIKFYRASGPGGQNRNKVSTGVRLTHDYMKIVIESDNQRTQYSNRVEAGIRIARKREEHLEKWLDIVTAKPDIKMGKAISEKIEFVSNKLPDQLKSGSVIEICAYLYNK